MVRPGQPEPRPALGSAGRGCRRAGCGSRQRRRRRATAAAVTGKIVQGERRTTEKVEVHAGKPGGSEDAAAASSAATPMAAARLGAERSERQGVRGAMERRERRRGPLGRSVLEAQGARRRDREAGTRQRQGRPARAWLPRSWSRVAVRPIQRTGGVRRSVRRGARVWASYGPIWFMGPKRSLFTSACSTFLI